MASWYSAASYLSGWQCFLEFDFKENLNPLEHKLLRKPFLFLSKKSRYHLKERWNLAYAVRNKEVRLQKGQMGCFKFCWGWTWFMSWCIVHGCQYLVEPQSGVCTRNVKCMMGGHNTLNWLRKHTSLFINLMNQKYSLMVAIIGFFPFKWKNAFTIILLLNEGDS